MISSLFDTTWYAFNPFAIPLGVTAIACLSLGVGVVLKEKGSSISRSFFVMVLTASIYLFGLTFRYLAATDGVALAWARFTYLGIPFLAPAIYSFVNRLLGQQDRRILLIRMAWLGALLFALVAVGTDLMVKGVRHYWWGPYDRFGPAIVPFLVFFGTLLLGSQIDLWRAFRSTVDEPQRRRARAFAILLAVACLAGFDYLPAFGVEVLPMGFLAVLAFLGGAAGTIERYKLVDITAAFAADQILATMAEPVLVCDAEGLIRVTNQAALSTLEYPEGGLDRRRLAMLGIDRDTESALESMLRGPDVRDRQLTLCALSGTAIATSMSVSALHDGYGRRVGSVVVARDIRQQKRIEEALRRSERHFRALIEHAHDLIVVMAPDGRIKYESPSIERMLGFRSEERVGGSYFDNIHPEDRELARDAFARSMKEPGTVVMEEVRVMDRHGNVRHFEVRARNLIDEPAVNGIVANIRDITEGRRVEARLLQRQRLEAVGQLAGGVAHDFNNLLTAIQGHTCLLLENTELPEGVVGELHAIEDGADRAAELTRQLLAFSRQQVRRPATIDLNRIVTGLRPMLERLIGEHITLEVRLADHPVEVRADAGQLDQVLLNLALNARDAMPEGGTLTIETAATRLGAEDLAELPEARSPGDYSVLAIGDTGHGMDEATRAHIFEPFFSTKALGKGTGLGLSTVYGIVQQSGGFVSIDTAPEAGSTFRVVLPAVGRKAAAAS